MLKTPAYAAQSPTSKLAPFSIDRREPKPNDVLIDIKYCGVCHSDIHQVRDEWGGSIYPMVPGHEIVGTVARVGSKVTQWKVGDTVGVGVFVNSCRVCDACVDGEEQYCENGMVETYNSYERDGVTPTYGGYSTRITVDAHYVLQIPDGMPLDATAPLLCAGITTYSPMVHWMVGRGDSIAVLGLGGLGHMAVKIAHALGAHVTVLSHSPKKKEDALRLGADDFVVTKEPETLQKHRRRFRFILDTVSAQHDYNLYLKMLRRDGTMCLVGIPEPSLIEAGKLVSGRKTLAGSAVGGIRETQQMLDFCAKHKISADIELIPIQKINEAYARVLKSDVKYRFVIDCGSIA